ncbi:MAG: hypothetical protein GXO89_10860 [Chlorobi bacterium]|nr:hypothetical protein [Chlorobiota bacterium]
MNRLFLNRHLAVRLSLSKPVEACRSLFKKAERLAGIGPFRQVGEAS